MVRRTYLVFILMTTLVGLMSVPADAQSGRVFYIDYASGSNSNPGTQAAPWKTHPYMQTGAGCTGTGSAPAYSHQAGDQFIFKGGVSWPAACFQMTLTAGGASGNSDYYGVDKTWFTGASFARPKFDLAQNVPSGNHVIELNSNNFISIDNIEIVNQGISAQVSGSAAIHWNQGACCNVTVTNTYIHDWITNGTFSNTLGGPDYPMGSIDGYVILDHSEISDANGFAYNSTGNKITVGFGGACHNCQAVQFSKIHDTMAACFTVDRCHDSEFYNITQTLWDTAPPTGFGLTDAGPVYARPHTQVVENDYALEHNVQVYNNYIHDNPTVGVTITEHYDAQIYNNVLFNNANKYIYIDDRTSAQSGLTGSIYNNIIDCSNGWLCIGWIGTFSGGGTLNIKNNLFITNSSAVQSFSGTSYTVSQSNNYSMSTSEASTYGFTSANKYFPSSSDPQVAGQGVNLISSLPTSLTSTLAPLQYDAAGAPWFGGSYNQRTSTWDLGAFVGAHSSSSTSSKPNPPSNLAAVVQ